MQAEVVLTIRDRAAADFCRSIDMAELCIVASCHVVVGDQDSAVVSTTTNHKCGRCWRHLPEVSEDGALCSRCDQVVASMDAVA